ncbi:MAG: hypothetical protein LAT67_13985 [Balneolales bacterium]|nr:hypothetical protein [Balneolales bacterium]
MASRTYSQNEIQKILKRAAQLETQRSGTSDSGKGLTLEELQTIASESGIDPDLVRLAAMENNTSSNSTFIDEDALIAQIKDQEIVSTFGLDGKLSPKIINDLFLELNHRYGVSEDDRNWWNDLWNSTAGLVKTKKSSDYAEWRFTNENETYSIRLLLQQRGSKTRFRLSKRLLWGISWSSVENLSFVVIPPIIIGSIITGLTVFDNIWQGLAIGAAASAFAYPICRYYSQKFVRKGQNEVTEIAEELSRQFASAQSDASYEHSEPEIQSHSKTIDIDIFDEPETISKESSWKTRDSGRLRNELR